MLLSNAKIKSVMKKRKKPSNILLDLVVEETRARRRAFTARFDNDPDKLFAEIRRIEKEDPDKSKYVSEIKIVRKAS